MRISFLEKTIWYVLSIGRTKKGWKLGKDIGLISYDDTPIKENISRRYLCNLQRLSSHGKTCSRNDS
jgi:hypothetical protein